MKKAFYIDMHCHPALKPFGKSYSEGDVNSKNVKDANCIWFYDRPTVWDKFVNISGSLTRFSQSNFTALARGNVRIISASLAPIEKGFFSTRLGEGKLIDKICNLVTGVGKEKVNFIQNNKNYFHELKKEYDFYEQLDGEVFSIDGKKWQYKLCSSFNDIQENLNKEDISTVSVVLSIEGCHVFIIDSNRRVEELEVIANIRWLKGKRYRPLFVSLSHHFYNDICGHAESLNKSLRKLISQKHGQDSGISQLGRKVVDELLSVTNGRRIFLDVKHMSRESRRNYYEILESEAYRDEDIPIVVSHGAVNGFPSVFNHDSGSMENGLFYGKDINFFDDELVLIAESKGLFCLQLDERRVASKREIKKVRFRINRKKMLKKRSGFVWNQIQYIAQVLDKHDLPAWNMTALGSDFDGIVDPINGFWTSQEFPLLHQYLLEHAEAFIEDDITKLKHDFNRELSASEIVSKIMQGNALEFLKQHF